MIRGIYTSASGMSAMIDLQNTIANNLANVDTVGYKRDNVVNQPFDQLLLNAYSKQGSAPIGTLGLGVQSVSEVSDFSNGNTLPTGNSTDLALEGPGLFAVQGGNGIRYSRAGNFQVSKDGYLVTKLGDQVLGQNGPIKLNGTFTVNSDGGIVQNGKVVDKLQIMSQIGMTKEGPYYKMNGTARPATGFQVIQGSLEQSNVNTINEMIQMINVSRNYDTNQRALTAHDDALSKAVNDLAK